MLYARNFEVQINKARSFSNHNLFSQYCVTISVRNMSVLTENISNLTKNDAKFQESHGKNPLDDIFKAPRLYIEKKLILFIQP